MLNFILIVENDLFIEMLIGSFCFIYSNWDFFVRFGIYSVIFIFLCEFILLLINFNEYLIYFVKFNCFVFYNGKYIL